MAWYRQQQVPWSSVPSPGDGYTQVYPKRRRRYGAMPTPTQTAGPGLQITPNVDERPVIFDPTTLAPGYGPDPNAAGPPPAPAYPPHRDVVYGSRVPDVIRQKAGSIFDQYPQGMPQNILSALGHQIGQSNDWRAQIARMAASFQPSDQLSRIRNQAIEFSHNQGGAAEDAFSRLEQVASAQTAASRLAQLLAARRPSRGRIFGG